MGPGVPESPGPDQRRGVPRGVGLGVRGSPGHRREVPPGPALGVRPGPDREVQTGEILLFFFNFETFPHDMYTM